MGDEQSEVGPAYCAVCGDECDRPPGRRVWAAMTDNGIYGAREFHELFVTRDLAEGWLRLRGCEKLWVEPFDIISEPPLCSKHRDRVLPPLVGDGVTDETDAVVAWLTAGATLPPGTYRTTRTMHPI